MPLRSSEAFEIFTNEYHWQLSQNRTGDNMEIETVNEQFSVCVDCLMYLANGELDNDPDNRLEDIEKEYKKLKEDNYDVFLSNDEGSFGSLPCNLCGSHLGGDRFDTTLVKIKS